MLVLKFIVLPTLVYWSVYIFMRSVVGLGSGWAAVVSFIPAFILIEVTYLTEVRRRDRVDE